MSSDLKSTTKRGLIWSAIERFGTQGVQFVFAVVLARLLSPEAYGIIAMPMVFLALAQIFIDSGFSSALVRKPDLTESDLSTAFYFNIVVGVVCYLILYVLSPFIADFYETPILSDLLKVTSLTVLFNPLCIVQQTILTKKIDFKTQAKVSLLTTVLAGVVGIIMAFKGYGVWALVVQQVGSAFARVVALWYLSSWRPQAKWSSDSFHYLWNYGCKLLASGVLDTIYNNIYPIVIGKFYSAGSLGVYTRAQHFADLPSMNITGVLQRVTFPVLSSIQNEDDRLTRNYRQLLKLSAFVVFPLMAMLAGISEPMIRILLGEQWIETVLLLQIICFGLMWYPIHAINLSLLLVKGRSDLSLKLEIIKKTVGLILLCVSIPMGIIALCYASIISSIISLVVNTYYTGKMINHGFFRQIKDIMPTLLISISMWAIILFVNSQNPCLLTEMIFGILLGILFYSTASFFFNREIFMTVLSLIRK